MSPLEVVNKLLSNPADLDNVRSVTTSDVRYISLNRNNPQLTRVLPWAGEHRGPEEIVRAFQGMYTMWEPQGFEVTAAFSEGEDVAMFGEFTYRSKEVGKAVTSPFGIHLKVANGKISYLLFLEDTLITTSSVQTGGEAAYASLGKAVTLKA